MLRIHCTGMSWWPGNFSLGFRPHAFHCSHAGLHTYHFHSAPQLGICPWPWHASLSSPSKSTHSAAPISGKHSLKEILPSTPSGVTSACQRLPWDPKLLHSLALAVLSWQHDDCINILLPLNLMRRVGSCEPLLVYFQHSKNKIMSHSLYKNWLNKWFYNQAHSCWSFVKDYSALTSPNCWHSSSSIYGFSHIPLGLARCEDSMPRSSLTGGVPSSWCCPHSHLLLYYLFTWFLPHKISCIFLHISTLHGLDWALPNTQQKPVHSLKFTHKSILLYG